MIVNIARFETKPDYSERWPELVAPLTAATRAEQGNLWFDWSRSIGIRSHTNPSYRGLRIIEGFRPNYPLQDSFFQRSFGVGVRHRGAACVTQIKSSGSYDLRVCRNRFRALCLACSCRPLARDTHLGAARCRQTERPATEPQFSDRYDTVNGLTSGPASALNSELLPTDRSGVGSDLPCAL